jgi:hypothetical protein
LDTSRKILNPEFGYQFNDENNQSYVEFCVDYCTSNQGKDAGDALLVFENPSMSIRAPHGSIPIEVFGQDESVLSQFIFSIKSWMGPKSLGEGLMISAFVSLGEGLMISAFVSLGEGLMILAFVSLDSGFGMPVSSAQLDAINHLCYGTNYIDKVAAMSIHLTACKTLTNSVGARRDQSM